MITSTPNYNSLPRRSSGSSGMIGGGNGGGGGHHHNPFQRNTMARRSTGVLDNHIEYFVPRSISEFNLSGVGDLAIMPPTIKRGPLHGGGGGGGGGHPLPPSAHSTLMTLPKAREKMVTFEDESSKCPHGIPTTPRKGPIVNDVFM